MNSSTENNKSTKKCCTFSNIFFQHLTLKSNLEHEAWQYVFYTNFILCIYKYYTTS